MALHNLSNRSIVVLIFTIATVALISCTTLHSFVQPSSAGGRASKNLELDGTMLFQQGTIVQRVGAKGSDLAYAASLMNSLQQSRWVEEDASEDASYGGGAALRGTLMQQTTMNATNSSGNSSGNSSTSGKELLGWTEQFHTSAQSVNAGRIGYQLLFGVLFYVIIVKKYPLMANMPMARVPQAAVDFQKKGAIEAVFDTSCPINFQSFCCPGPRAALTFHATGVLDYWPGCILMSLFPCCMLWATMSFTELKERLGGEKDNFLKSCLCAWCCSCCVIAKDAQSLDLRCGVETELFGVKTPEAPLQPLANDQAGQAEQIIAQF